MRLGTERSRIDNDRKVARPRRHPSAAALPPRSWSARTSIKLICMVRSWKQGVIQRATGSGAPRRRPSAAKTWLKAIELTSRIEAEPHRLFADVVEEWAQRQPGRPALLSDGQSFTYGELAARINRYARWALGLGIRTGCTVCLLMPNRPDYLACWLGISRVGGTVALINTRLVGQSLAHCIDVAHADHVILAADCVDAFETARPHLDRVPQIWSLGAGGAGADLDAALAAADHAPAVLRRTRRRHDRWTRAPDLHLGHHGAAEGGEHQSSPHSQLGRLVCRADGRFRPTIGSTIACRSIIPSAASSRPAACSAPAVRS